MSFDGCAGGWGITFDHRVERSFCTAPQISQARVSRVRGWWRVRMKGTPPTHSYPFLHPFPIGVGAYAHREPPGRGPDAHGPGGPVAGPGCPGRPPGSLGQAPASVSGALLGPKNLDAGDGVPFSDVRIGRDPHTYILDIPVHPMRALTLSFVYHFHFINTFFISFLFFPFPLPVLSSKRLSISRCSPFKFLPPLF